MKSIYKFKYVYLLLICVTLSSCKKFLDEKAEKKYFLPTSIEDLRALLDNSGMFTSGPGLLEILSDEYFITAPYWQGLTSDLSLNYIWAPTAVPYNRSWNDSYMNPIYYSNIVLDQLSELKLPIDEKSNAIKGTALFYRGCSFFNIAQVFAKPYDQTTLSDLGIVLRITSDINVRSTRATISETYKKIVSDLKEAADLLPIATDLQTRPTKAAAHAALARVYLNMRDYENASKYADLALQSHAILLDFNNLIPGVPIRNFNQEVISHSNLTSVPMLSGTNAKIDPVLLTTYSQYDLRRSIFFRANTGANAGTFAFRGSYAGTDRVDGMFSGTTTAEMLLIRAECYARKGDKIKAIDDINMLLVKRMDKNNWTSINPASVNDALALVLAERRKELVFRGLRWMDLKRLNMEGANITLKRVISNVEYLLPPNDTRWEALIPYDVINRSGIPQNPR